MRKRLIGLRHLVRIIPLLNRIALQIKGIHKLTSERLLQWAAVGGPETEKSQWQFRQRHDVGRVSIGLGLSGLVRD